MVLATFEFEFAAGIATIAITGIILLVGWLTRTPAVAWLSIALGLFWSLAIGVFVAYRIDSGEELEGLDIAALRLVAGVEAILMFISVWVLIRLRKQRPVVSSAVPTVAHQPMQPEYDRNWLLSLLQSRVAESCERVAKTCSTDRGR